MTTRQLKIVGGPSLDSVIDAFKYAFDGSAFVAVRFTVEANNSDRRREIEPRIIGIRYETSTPGQFILTMNGYFWGSGAHHGAEAIYDSRTRKGIISIPS